MSALVKSTSERFARYIDAESLQALKVKLIGLLQGDAQVDFNSTCLKAPAHRPVDWVLLRNATRTLMKAIERLRKEGEGLVCWMSLGPLSFLSDMNTLCMEMTGKHRTVDGKKPRKAVFIKMKILLKHVCISI